MPDQLVNNNYYQETAEISQVIVPDYYESHGVFSLNASNQLSGTLWLTKNGELVNQDLGVANFAVYDKTGAAVGISQTGISPNIVGQYITSAHAASVLTDLTHYVIKIGIVAEGEERIAHTGIVLGE